MGAIKVHEFIALDGVYEDPSWTFEFGFDPKMGEALAAITGSCRAILLGRRTFEMFAPAWSTRTAERGPGRAVLQRVAQVRRRPARRGPRTGTTPPSSARTAPTPSVGSRTRWTAISTSAAAARWSGPCWPTAWFDELHLFVYPVARGAGQRLLAESGPATKFSLAGSEAYSNGVVHLSYAPAAG